MKNRRKARELALQALFYMDIRKNASNEALSLYRRCFFPSETEVPFFEHLTMGVIRNQGQIDAVIERFSSNWKINRMACVDRNILRIAIYEMLFCEDIPLKVSINEAIEIGKRYGTEDSGAFINGILDSVNIAFRNKEIVPSPENNHPILERPAARDAPSDEDSTESPKVVLTPVRGHPGIVKRRIESSETQPTKKHEGSDS